MTNCFTFLKVVLRAINFHKIFLQLFFDIYLIICSANLVDDKFLKDIEDQIKERLFIFTVKLAMHADRLE